MVIKLSSTSTNFLPLPHISQSNKASTPCSKSIPLCRERHMGQEKPAASSLHPLCTRVLWVRRGSPCQRRGTVPAAVPAAPPLRGHARAPQPPGPLHLFTLAVPSSEGRIRQVLDLEKEGYRAQSELSYIKYASPASATECI